MIYIVHGEDDSAALVWLERQKQSRLPDQWRSFNFHSCDLKKISTEELRNVLESYPMGSDYRLVLIRELDKAEAGRKKELAGLLENLPPTTIAALWFVPGPKDPKKLPLGTGWKGVLSQAEFVKCVSRAPEEEANVFTFLDGVGERRPARALTALRSLLERGEPPLRLLAALINQTRLLRRIQILEEAGSAPAEIAGRLGIHPYRVNKGLSHARKFKSSEWSRFYDWMTRADFSLKTGGGEPDHVLELLVLRMSRPA